MKEDYLIEELLVNHLHILEILMKYLERNKMDIKYFKNA